MTEEDAFLLAVLSDPEDAAPRLVYADWLLDRGDPRSELVRLAFGLRSARASHPDRKALAARWARAREEHGWQEYDGLLLTWEQMVTVFRIRLAETIAHCAAVFPRTWTWELEPLGMIGRGGAWPLADEDDSAWVAMTHKLAGARRRALEMAGRAPSDLAAGRLLTFVPSWSLSDGAAAIESRKFFDVDNVPSWDSWVTYVPERAESGGNHWQGYLLAWVPPSRLGDANAGIQVNPEECIVWTDQVTSPLLGHLRQAGLTGC